MRRPFLFAAVSMGIGIFTASLWALPLGLSAGLILTGLGIRFWMQSERKKKPVCRIVLLFFCFFLTGNLMLQYDRGKTDFMERNVGAPVTVYGRVTDIKQKGDAYYQCMIRVLYGQCGETDGAGGMALIRYYGNLQDSETLPGKTVKVAGIPELPAAARNPGLFDYRQYLRTLGVSTVMEAGSFDITDRKKSRITGAIWGIRTHFAKALAASLGTEQSGLICAMMFGDKSGLDENVYQLFQKNGTAHILAVSGLHIGILYGFVQMLWPWKKGALFYWFILVFLLSYMALASFSPSVVRAGCMIVIHILAKLLHRRYDLLSAAACVFMGMLVVEPEQLFHAGFQLSFLAIVSLGVLLSALPGKRESVWLSAIAIQLGMTPYTSFLFHSFSLAALLINIPVLFLAGLLIPLGLLLLLLSFGPLPLFSAAAAVMEIGCRVLVACNQLAYLDGKTVCEAAGPPVFLLLLYYGSLFFFCSEKGRILLGRRMWKPLILALCVIVLAAGIFSAGIDRGWSKQDLIFLDVGQGDCLFLRTEEGGAYLIDGGGTVFQSSYDVGRDTLKPFLLRHGIRRLDGAFVTHLHEDHYGGIRALAQEGMIKQLGLYEGNRVQQEEICKETGLKSESLLYLYRGQSITLGDEVFLEVLSPERKTEPEYEKMVGQEADENLSSLILKVHYRGISVLMTGDIDQAGEQKLVEHYGTGLASDILKIPHHGSKYSGSDVFFDAVDPKIAVFQVGKNNFGHPSDAVVEKCRQKGIMIYRNDRDGAVGCSIDRKRQTIRVKTMCRQENYGRIQQ